MDARGEQNQKSLRSTVLEYIDLLDPKFLMFPVLISI